MYKIKESSGKNVIIKFSKQNEVNYQSVCLMNDILHKSCLLPFEFQIKLFKIHMIYDAGELMRFSDFLKGQIDKNTLAGLLTDLFNSIGSFSSTGLDAKGLIYRADCMFVNAAGQVKMIYAPAYSFDESNNLDNFVNSLLKLKAADADLCNLISQLYPGYCGKPMNVDYNAQSNLTGPFSEGETTVLSVQPAMPQAQPSVYSFNEGETTVLSAQPAMSQDESSSDLFSEGETTVLSADSSPFAESSFASAAEVDDLYNENATCLVLDSDFDVNNNAVPSETESVITPDFVHNMFDYNDHHMPEDSHGDYSEKETTIPNVGHPLSSDRTLIGSEGLAHAMAYSAIQANEKAADSYETVLLSDESIDKTAFFIRFINSQAVYITKNYFTIGSGADMDYMISGNSLVSKYHATIVIENSKFYIIDNKSTNKVYVDGREAEPFEKNEIFTGSRVVLANEIFDFYIK